MSDLERWHPPGVPAVLINRALRRNMREVYNEHIVTSAKIASVEDIGERAMQAAMKIDQRRLELLGADPTDSRAMTLAEIQAETLLNIRKVQRGQFSPFKL